MGCFHKSVVSHIKLLSFSASSSQTGTIPVAESGCVDLLLPETDSSSVVHQEENSTTPKQAPLETPRKAKMKRTLAKLRTQLWRKKSRKFVRRDKPSNLKHVCSLIDHFLPTATASFVKSQIKIQMKTSKRVTGGVYKTKILLYQCFTIVGKYTDYSESYLYCQAKQHYSRCCSKLTSTLVLTIKYLRLFNVKLTQ